MKRLRIALYPPHLRLRAVQVIPPILFSTEVQT
jgi:hypothetical protein